MSFMSKQFEAIETTEKVGVNVFPFSLEYVELNIGENIYLVNPAELIKAIEKAWDASNTE